jgi:hypothetical protein
VSILVLEGADGTGKTFLAKELEKRGYRYEHESQPPTDDLFEHYTRKLLSARGQRVCFDRLHVGELIYGPVMRGKSLITIEQMRLLNRLLYSMGGKLIFCDTSDYKIQGNWLKRKGQEYVDRVDKILDIAAKYRQCFDQEFTDHDTIAYDYCGSYFLERIKQFFPYDAAPDFLKRRACLPGVIGSPEAKFLFIGERVNEKLSFGEDLAFYSMENSAGFLNRCLWDAGYPEFEVSFTNAIALGGCPRNLYALWQRGLPVVIALGKVAHQACVNQAVPHLAAPHPQFVKRFEAKKRGSYVELLNRFRGGV